MNGEDGDLPRAGSRKNFFPALPQATALTGGIKFADKRGRQLFTNKRKAVIKRRLMQFIYMTEIKCKIII